MSLATVIIVVVATAAPTERPRVEMGASLGGAALPLAGAVLVEPGVFVGVRFDRVRLSLGASYGLAAIFRYTRGIPAHELRADLSAVVELPLGSCLLDVGAGVLGGSTIARNPTVPWPPTDNHDALPVVGAEVLLGLSIPVGERKTLRVALRGDGVFTRNIVFAVTGSGLTVTPWWTFDTRALLVVSFAWGLW